MTPPAALQALYRKIDHLDDRHEYNIVLDALYALWAVRVLDAWAKYNGPQTGCWYVTQGSMVALHRQAFGKTVPPQYIDGDTPDAARLAAAEAVWPELPESVRAEIGERP